MASKIAALLTSENPRDVKVVQDVFRPKFQKINYWETYLRWSLSNGSVCSQLDCLSSLWAVNSFHALYVACWIYFPLEKGTFMIDLGGLRDRKVAEIEANIKRLLYSRLSSHLSGNGYSASNGWSFLNGYHELLVQFEESRGQPFLLLKAEGHTTKLSGVIPHLASMAYKGIYGHGVMASRALHDAAAPGNEYGITERAAENYNKGYEKLLGVLNLKGKKVLVREALSKLFSVTGFQAQTSAWFGSTNAYLGEELSRYCDLAEQSPNSVYTLKGKVTEKMIGGLREVAKALMSDLDQFVPRVFAEVRVQPRQVDGALAEFYDATRARAA